MSSWVFAVRVPGKTVILLSSWLFALSCPPAPSPRNHPGIILVEDSVAHAYYPCSIHCSIHPHSHPELDLDLSFDRESRSADCASHWASYCPGHTGIILGLGGLRMPMPQNCPFFLASNCLTYHYRPSSWHQPAFRVLENRKTE